MSLVATGLIKRYGPRQVVAGVDLQVERGETIGLLGPNGAGKTTTFYMLVGLVAPNRGAVTLDGRDLSAAPDASPRAARHRLSRAGELRLPPPLRRAEHRRGAAMDAPIRPPSAASAWKN